jgi:DNA-binding MarR family transcriptional regulator
MALEKTYKIKKDLTDKEIILKLLDNVNKEDNITQKVAAKKIGIAVGLVNTYVKRCIQKGWVKVKNIPAHRYAYYLTPQGFSKKSQLVSEYLTDSFKLFRESKLSYQKIFLECKKKKYLKIVLAGISDLTEIAILVGGVGNINILGVIQTNKTKKKFSYKTYNFANVPKNIDAIIITEINNANDFYKFLKIKFPEVKIFYPDFLKITKK